MENFIGITAMVIVFVVGVAFIYFGLVRIFKNRNKRDDKEND